MDPTLDQSQQDGNGFDWMDAVMFGDTIAMQWYDETHQRPSLVGAITGTNTNSASGFVLLALMVIAAMVIFK